MASKYTKTGTKFSFKQCDLPIPLKMLKKVPKSVARNRILDTLHRGVVNVMMGTTVLCMSYIGYRCYQFLVHDRPLIIRKENKFAHLLDEGAHDRDIAKELDA